MPDIVVRAIRPDELEHVADLAAFVFSQGDPIAYNAIFRRYMNDFPSRPGFSFRHFRAAFFDGRMVSVARIEQHTLHYGQAKLKIGGIAGVCTHASYRKRGFSGAIIRDLLTFMAEQGAHMALLRGVPHYYERFGFMPVWPRYAIQMPSADASSLPQPNHLRLAEKTDIPAMARLYNRHWGARVTFSRLPALWQWRLETSPQDAIVATNASGAIEGYLWNRQGDYDERVEVVADTPEAISTLLAYCGKRWQSANYDTFEWAVPPDDYIIPHARILLPVSLSAHYTPSGGWMGRMIDSTALIHELLPEIHAQAHGTSRTFEPKNLVIRVERDGVDVGMQGQSGTFCHLALRDFIQILFGSLRPATLAVRQYLSPDSIALLELLFPPRIASVAAWDWF